jgi:molybdopterin/thiamine biosynthesis adenylyltransferase
LYTGSNSSHTCPTVLVVGMGALGCPAATALAEAGGVRLILADDDVVETTNLQRQRLFARSDVGCPKVEAAARNLQHRYPNVSVETRIERLTADNAYTWFQQADFVIDACDDPATKFLINAVAINTQTPFVYGGVLRTGGSTMTVLPGKSPCLACVFPQAAQASEEPGCDRAGILAPVAGVIGTRQALAALAWLSADSRADGGVLTAYELRGRRWHALRFDRVSDCRICGQPRMSAPTPRRVQPCLS